MSKGRAIFSIIITFVLLAFTIYFGIGMINSFNDVNDALKEQAAAEKELADAEKELEDAKKELAATLE